MYGFRKVRIFMKIFCRSHRFVRIRSDKRAKIFTINFHCEQIKMYLLAKQETRESEKKKGKESEQEKK